MGGEKKGKEQSKIIRIESSHASQFSVRFVIFSQSSNNDPSNV